MKWIRDRNKRRRVLVVFGLYLVTWIGGWISHSQDMSRRAERLYDRTWRRFQLEPESGLKGIYLFTDGPKSHVNWCVPLLPGVLLTHSSYLAGPVNGNVSYRLVTYFGFGSFEVVEMQYMLL
jgi:hypothetical protein